MYSLWQNSLTGYQYGFILATKGIILFAILVITISFLKNQKAKRDALKKVQRQFSGVQIVSISSDAFFCGLDRSWGAQWQGRGVLMLTDDMLYFRHRSRGFDLTIPMPRVKDVQVITGVRFRAFPAETLKVTYRGVDGHTRIATWVLKRPQRWLQHIQKNRRRFASDANA